MTAIQRRDVCANISDIWSELLSLRFDSIGSLYESKDGRIYVGPMTFLPSDNMYSIAPPIPEQCGPFQNPKDWLLSLARREMEFVSSLVMPPEDIHNVDVVVHDILASSMLDAPDAAVTSEFALEHVDLAPHNIIVDSQDPTKIVGVIDWEGARVVPLWVIQPRFLMHCELPDPKEMEALLALISAKVGMQVPHWNAATSQDLRRMYLRALYSDWEPAMVAQMRS